MCYPAGISLSPELGSRPRLETGFISLLADLSMTHAGLHIGFLFSCVDDGKKPSVTS